MHTQPPDPLDTRTFEGLYAQWAEPVARYVAHLIGPGQEAEDVCQETWLAVVEKWVQLRDRDRFGAWVYRIARNRVYNRGRKGKRKGQVWIFSNLAGGGEDADQVLETRPDGRPGPAELAIGGERREILARAVAELDAQGQEMMQLRFFEQLTLAEIAEVMEVPHGTVCAKVHRSLKQVRRRMKQMGYADVNLM